MRICPLLGFLIGFCRVQDSLLQTFLQKEDFVLLNFKFKVEFAVRSASEDVKKIFNLTGTVLIKPDKISASRHLKEKLSGEGEKI